MVVKHRRGEGRHAELGSGCGYSGGKALQSHELTPEPRGAGTHTTLLRGRREVSITQPVQGWDSTEVLA